MFKAFILSFKNISSRLNKIITHSEKKTSKNNKLQINLALNYGSKFELISAFKKLKKSKKKFNEKKVQAITDNHIKSVDEKVSLKEKEIMTI